MAIEAKHLNAQFTEHRQFLNPTNQGKFNPAYNLQHMGFLELPYAASSFPENQSIYKTVVYDSIHAKTSINTDSNIQALRKRSRDSTNQLYAVTNYPATAKHSNVSQLSSFAGEDILPQIQQYQEEIDANIFQHTKKIRLDLQDMQKQHARIPAAAFGKTIMCRLKEKDEQIQKMVKLNLTLQERVKSLCFENQLWMDLAQSNEATVNSLRNHLEQVLLDVGAGGGVVAVDEDVGSCCGSVDDHEQDKDDEISCYSERECRMCGERESCVLLLPCRHLCICSVCGSGSRQLQECPVCNCSMNATLHINMS